MPKVLEKTVAKMKFTVTKYNSEDDYKAGNDYEVSEAVDDVTVQDIITTFLNQMDIEELRVVSDNILKPMINKLTEEKENGIT